MNLFRKTTYVAFLLLLCLCLFCQSAQAEEMGTPTPAPTPEPTPAAAAAPSFQAATPVPFLRLRRSLLPTDRDRYYDKRTGQYVVFGSFGPEADGAFYACGEDGTVPCGAEPLPMADFLVSPYAPEQRPKQDGDR